ncbi:MAG TPA: hypothetical protein PK683_15410, partial [Leptospiraceae bacterium]|nr:hypothetical protein [Leptospiraceae bacterium]
MVSLALSGLIITEGFAFTGNTFPFWTGPLLAGIGLLLVLSVKQVSEFFKKPFSRVLESSHIGAFIYSGIGILYALAYTMSSDENNSALSLLSGSAQGLFGGWMLYPVLGITFMLIAASLFVGSVQWKETLSTAASAGGFLFTAVSLLSLFPFGCSSALCTKGTGTMLLEMFPWFSAVTAITAVAAFTASVYSEERRKDFSAGSAYSSDILIVCTGIFLGIFMRISLQSSLKYSDFAGLAAISTVIFISLAAAYRNRKAIHLYFAQTAIASLYLAIKPAFPDLLNDQADAIAALIFGFILTGVTAAAHRAGVPTLAESTRRFAAFMPVMASLVLPAQANYQNAGMAAFSAALYAALSTVSSNRIYAVLAAASANLSIFTAVMASQVQGIEVYLAPFGLFSLLLGQIFKENLSDSVRKTIRLAGGLLLYLPAALKISFEIGQGADAMYAVVFGLLCLIGIVAGMVFQIRSYLFMGTVFFTLNLGVNVVQVGLRDQKAGFLLLSITGILIIAALVFYTVKKDFVATYLSRLNK